MTTTTTRAPLPAPLRVVIAILFVGAALGLYRTVRGSMSTGFDMTLAVKALPLIQALLAIGLIRRSRAARVATMLWYAFTTLSSVFVLLTLMGGQEPLFAKGPPAFVATVMVIIIIVSLLNYFLLTRPIVMAAFASVE
jgi:hypothetical protein